MFPSNSLNNNNNDITIYYISQENNDNETQHLNITSVQSLLRNEAGFRPAPDFPSRECWAEKTKEPLISTINRHIAHNGGMPVQLQVEIPRKPVQGPLSRSETDLRLSSSSEEDCRQDTRALEYARVFCWVDGNYLEDVWVPTALEQIQNPNWFHKIISNVEKNTAIQKSIFDMPCQIVFKLDSRSVEYDPHLENKKQRQPIRYKYRSPSNDDPSRFDHFYSMTTGEMPEIRPSVADSIFEGDDVVQINVPPVVPFLKFLPNHHGQCTFMGRYSDKFEPSLYYISVIHNDLEAHLWKFFTVNDKKSDPREKCWANIYLRHLFKRKVTLEYFLEANGLSGAVPILASNNVHNFRGLLALNNEDIIAFNWGGPAREREGEEKLMLNVCKCLWYWRHMMHLKVKLGYDDAPVPTIPSTRSLSHSSARSMPEWGTSPGLIDDPNSTLRAEENGQQEASSPPPPLLYSTTGEELVQIIENM